GPEVVGARHEIRLAIQLHQHAHPAVEVHVRLDQPLGRGAARALVGLGRPPPPPGRACSPSSPRPCGRGAPPPVWPECRSQSPRCVAPHKKAALAPDRLGRAAVVAPVRPRDARPGRAQPSPPPPDSAGAGASSVLRRAAIASGLGRRLRRTAFFLRSPSASASTPVSVE